MARQEEIEGTGKYDGKKIRSLTAAIRKHQKARQGYDEAEATRKAKKSELDACRDEVITMMRHHELEYYEDGKLYAEVDVRRSLHTGTLDSD